MSANVNALGPLLVVVLRGTMSETLIKYVNTKIASIVLGYNDYSGSFGTSHGVAGYVSVIDNTELNIYVETDLQAGWNLISCVLMRYY